MKTMFISGTLARATEKAICFKTQVLWGAGKTIQKDVWFPKSTVVDTTKNGLEVKYEMAFGIICQNTFHGYDMKFVNSNVFND